MTRPWERFRLSALAGAILGSMLAAASAEAVPLKLPPIEQCTDDRSFAAFRTKLNDVAKREDATALFAMSGPTRPAPGDEAVTPAGQSESADYLAPEDWSILRAILRMGCTRSGSQRLMPSAPVQLGDVPGAELKHKLIALPGAKLLEEPNDEKSARATLQWDVVNGVGFASDTGTIVQLADGREGWVSDESLYWLDPSVRYEIAVEKRGGKWMIVDHWW